MYFKNDKSGMAPLAKLSLKGGSEKNDVIFKRKRYQLISLVEAQLKSKVIKMVNNFIFIFFESRLIKK